MNCRLKSVVVVACAAVLVAAAGQVEAAPIVYNGSLSSGVTVFGDVPLNSYADSTQWDFWTFIGNAGDVVTITLDRTSDQMDPGVALYFGIGGDTAGLSAFPHTNPTDALMTFLAQNDDGGSDIPPGPFLNSLIADFVLPSTGSYTVAAYDVLGASSGPWSYGLTVTGFSEVPEPSSVALLGMGITGLCGYGRRRKQKTDLTA